MKCYLTEYIDMPLADREDIRNKPQLVCEIQASVARFAQENKNTDLSSTMGMYSLFDLSPFDIPGGIDEKQENFNTLIALLKDLKEDALAENSFKKDPAMNKALGIFAVIPILLYNGRKGRGGRAMQIIGYAFYPAHMLILALIRYFI